MNHETHSIPADDWRNHPKERNMAQLTLCKHEADHPSFEAWHDKYGERFRVIFEANWKKVVALMESHPDASFKEIEQLYNETMH